MISFDEALALVAEQARPLGAESVPLVEAHNRFLARPVIARIDHPRSDVSAMDGYAMRDSDWRDARVIGESFPGAPFGGRVGQGEAVRIFTGASVPDGAERVVIQEDVRRDGDRVSCEAEPGPARHIRRRGFDFRAGDVLLEPGRRLDARALVAAAGADAAKVEVSVQPRLAILSTGDELVEPGTARETASSIPDSVSFGVAALASDYGARVVSRERVGDDRQAMRSAAERALGAADLVVVTGGASVGEKDFAKPVFVGLGLELIFGKVAIKPGKPVWLGRAGDRLVLGLPGNPTSAMVTARLLLAPLLLGLSGGEPAEALRWRTASAGAQFKAVGNRETFDRAMWSGEAVVPVAEQDSGAQRALAEAQLLVRRKAGAPEASPGDFVEVLVS